ncbi:MAG: exodeoxyribonuclease VII large subunit [Duncaniella sp.]|nr:exodeoxyribonuclease VII large subunit [Duncaniella sp.]
MITSPDRTSLTLEQFTHRIADIINATPGLSDVWVTAETSDVRRSTHIYLELVQKDAVTGQPVARLRATIWRNVAARLDAEFFGATGRRLESGMKVRVKVTASFHPAYGLSANITAIDPSYTVGDLMRLRLEILSRLKAEGVLELNRTLPWPEPALRVAVISAPGAAGYGDFIHQLFTSPARLRFDVRLFPALMQGDRTPAAIISALDEIAAEEERWDCVVIIRGGGATADLAAFDNYELAANIAQFPLPVIVGIGHERDTTVLDYVANLRVKTPTAAAEYLISRGEALLARIDDIAARIVARATTLLSASREQLAYISASLPYAPLRALDNRRRRLENALTGISHIAATRLTPETTRLVRLASSISDSVARQTERQHDRLERIGGLLAVLSPQATLSRGYSITRVDGHAISSSDAITPGTRLTTTLSSGTITSLAE